VSRTDYDVLVLGAGAAGLAATRILANQGARVALIEARERVGGRILTRAVPTANGATMLPVELGAEFIHGLPCETWELVREAGLATYELAGQSAYFADGQLSTNAPGPGGWSVLEQMQRWLAQQPPGFDLPFAQFLQQAPVPQALWAAALSYVEGFNAADSQLISVVALSQQQRAEQSLQAERLFRVEAGYARVTDFLAQECARGGASIELGRTVRAIQWRPGAVTVTGTMDGAAAAWQLRAPRALITLPLGVLQAGAVRFDPPPGEKLAIAEGLRMGPVVRVTLLFRSAFWRELRSELDQLGFLFAPGQIPSTWWTPMPNEAPTLTAWVGGPAALIPYPSWLDRSLSSLAYVLQRPVSYIAPLLVSAHCHDWQFDPYARGAYSYVTAGAAQQSRRLSEPVEDTLFFAGEHTDLSFHWGTVHGALRSGVRAAQQIIAP
jgi:monoamine oxidase